ncbi:MAG: type I restriction enzyme HsdR N-terminal domain-containing protein [Muribaculaceae bacterium]|nr:type I restriction enzyme HsdR N-terminal domain-containing protein [Muribaculaceae bacterium]
MQNKTFHFCQLNLPAAPLRIEMHNGRWEVYDSIRDKWLVLTDEEWVRQNFVDYMCRTLGYPSSVIGNEIGLTLNRTQRRADTVVYGPDRRPMVIVEYKAPTVDITQAVFDQIVRYNMVLKARLLVVSNGLKHYCCEIDYENGSYKFLPELPHYKSLVS